MIQDCMAGNIDMIITKSHQPVCQKHLGLPEIYPGTEGKEHPGFL